MSYSQLINLFIILGLISYSYEYNAKNNYIRRRTRDALLKDSTQHILDKVLGDEGRLDDKIKEAIILDEGTVKEITKKILTAAKDMAEAGATHIRTVEEWTTIQGELRHGINIIIDAYIKYIDLHRTTCDAIETFAKSMITKYENELSTLNQLSVPTLGLDLSGRDPVGLEARMLQLSDYTRLHAATLPIAYDCIGDLTKRTLEHQSAIFYPPPNMMTYELPQQRAIDYPVQTISLPCNDVSGYNGCQLCSNAIATMTQGCATNTCPLGRK
jgi:hypothetical protein